MTSNPTPNSPLPPRDETVILPPAGDVSPGWSAQAQRPSDAFPVGSAQNQDVDLPVLASLLAEMKADRLSRQEEYTRSKDRLERIEEWMGMMSSGSGEGQGRPRVVPNATWYRSPGHLNRSGLPSRRESQSVIPPNRATARSFGTESFINDSNYVFPNDAPIDSSMNREMKEWLKNAQKITAGAASRKYDGRYWDLWKREMLIALREANLLKFIAHDFVPPAYGTLEYHQYSAGDPMAQRFILKHLDDERAHELSYMGTAAEMWDHLLSTEESRTVNDVRLMVLEWENLKQLPAESMQQFIRRIDILAAKLMEVNRVKDQDDKLYKLLNGLGPHWSSEKSAFLVTANLQTYKEVCAILLGIAVERGEVGDVAAGGEAHFTVSNKGNYRPNGKPAGWQSKLFCRGCGSNDHHTGDCPKCTLVRDANGRYPLNCFRCYTPGHVRKDCPNKNGQTAPGGEK